MKLLTRIIFVNWYLFEAKEWEIRGHTALIGANGSGKSSFLDAIQYVMLGGNRRDWKPNAKAPDKHSERDIRGYVLGVVKDEDSIGENSDYQPRDDALCRIGLVFTDEDTGEQTTVGAAISARRGDKHEDIEGFFILEGVDLTLSDFLDKTESGHEVPRSYAQIKALFNQRTSEQRRFLFGREPEKYVDQLMRSLCRADYLPDPGKYRRAFKQSISMTSLDGSVSDFVKTSILDAEPIDIAKMRDSIKSYERKNEAVVRTREQIEKLALISAVFKKAKTRAANAAAYEWCASELEFEALERKIKETEEEMRELDATFRTETEKMCAVGMQIKEAREKRDEVRALIDNDENETQRKLLTERKNNSQTDMDRVKREMKHIRDVLALSAKVLRHKDILIPDFVSLLDEMKRHAYARDMDPSSTDHLIEESRKALEKQRRELENRLYEAKSEYKQAESDRKNKQQLLKKIRQGKPALNQDTEILIRALDERNIAATPVCELTEIADQRWQPAIEAFLGNNAESLVVDPKDAEKAVSIYRSMKKQGLYKAVVVNTRKVQDWKDTARPGTAAHLIGGKNPYAVAYLQRLLLNMDLVDHTNDLVEADRALTPDGMFARQGGVQRLRLPDLPKVGISISQRQSQIDLLEQQIRKMEQRCLTTEQSSKQHESACEQLNNLFYSLEKVSSVKSKTKSLAEAQKRVDEIDMQISAIDLSQTERLRNELKRQDDWISRLEKEQQSHADQRQTAKTKSNEREKRQKGYKLLVPRLDTARKDAAADVDFDAEKSKEVLSSQRNKYSLNKPENYQKIIDRCRENAKRRRGESESDKTKGIQQAAIYKTEHGETALEMSGGGGNLPLDSIVKTVQGLLEELKDMGLHTREEEASNALREVVRVVRQDLAIRIQNQINKMKRRIRELNNELKTRPFSSDQIYQFRFDKRPEYTEFTDFLENVNKYDVADFEGLFDRHEGQIEVIRQMLDANEDEEMKDCRNYYRYDIEIRDEEAGIKERLSRKKGAGSGGEQRSPFYVAMGASLASAYRINREGDSLTGGLSLYLADEAFQSMDLQNTMQAANYLKSIGLQLFIAAPDESEPRMTGVVDTVMFFIREGVKVDVDITYPKEKLRKKITDSLIGGDNTK